MKTTTIATALLIGVTINGPCAAQSVLQQMEAEVSAIAQRTRSAVVTIEDSRALMVGYDTSSLERNDIESRIAQLDIEHTAAQSHLSTVEAQVRAGLADQLALLDARSRLARVDAELAAQHRRLEAFGHQAQPARYKQEAQDQIDLIQLDRQSLTQRNAMLDQLLKAGAVDRTAVEAGNLRLQEVNQQIEQAAKRRDAYAQLSTSNVVGRAYGRIADEPNVGRGETQSAEALLGRLGQAINGAPRSGTGFSIGDGYVVTTADVLTGMNHPVVVTDSGAKIRATVVGMDKLLNVGLIKVNSPITLPGLKLGDSALAVEGHFAISIGNQHGQSNAIALNLISGLRRQGTDTGDHYYPELIQIGGTVGAGTSGAPLMDSQGDVIGVIAGVPQSQPDPSELGYIVALPLGLAVDSKTTTAYNSRPSGANAPGLQHDARMDNSTVYVPALNSPAGFMLYTAPAQGSTAQAGRGSSTTEGGATARRRTTPGGVTNTAGSNTPALNTSGRNTSGASTSKPDAASSYTSASNAVGANNQNLRSVAKDTAVADNGVVNYLVGRSPMPPVVTNSGFAIPINDIRNVISALKAGKAITHGWIGVDLENLEQATEKDGILTVARSVKVQRVYTGGPAQRNGLLPGDVITSINGHAIQTSGDVRVAIIRLAVGDTANLAVRRGSATLAIALKVVARPSEYPPADATQTAPPASVVAPPANSRRGSQ